MDVLFPFGHGLSYTTFAYSNLRLDFGKSVLEEGDTVKAAVTVKNTGRRFGKAVVQLYVGAVNADPIRPVRELKGFEKVALQPGEEKDVFFTLDKRAFAMWNTQIHDWYVPAGQYRIEAGDSSRNLPLRTEITLSDSRELPRHYDMNSVFVDLMADPKAKALLKPIMEESSRKFAGEQNEGQTDAAKEAVSEEMGEAMMRYMPLRALVSFGASEDTARALEEIIRRIND